MCGGAQVFFLLLAVIACAVAIPASIPQPRALQPIEQRQVREVDPLEATAERNEDLKGSASYGYGHYGYGGYPGYYGYGYPGYYRPYYYGGYPNW